MRIKNITAYSVYSILLIFFHCHLFGNPSTQEILINIPQHERDELSEVFYVLFDRNSFCYTLFGDKPMSLATFKVIYDPEEWSLGREIRFWDKWAVWKKYASSFPISRYLLIEGPLEENGVKEIFFINKKSFREKVDEHLDLFRKELGEDITGPILLEKIAKNAKFIDCINTRPLLLGILLGYGEHNARLFDKRDKISAFVYREELPQTPVKVPKPSKEFASLQEEFNSYFSVLTLFGDPGYSPLMIHSVHFVADHSHPETILLKQKYRKMRGEISAIYAKGDFLEITLSKLTEK